MRTGEVGGRRVALDAGGAEGLERWLEVEREREMPEALRPRPKYYYYYEWMKQRIAKCFPDGLPAPVQDKLLAMDADEVRRRLVREVSGIEGHIWI